MSKQNEHNVRIRNKSQGHLPALILVSVLLIAAVLAGLYLERTTVIRSVHFSGNEFTPDSLLFSAMEDPVSLSADSVRFDSLFHQLRTLPYVDDVSVRMNRHGSLTFQIREHRPIALLPGHNSRNYLSEKGTLLPLIPGKAVNVPILHGVESEWVISNRPHKAVRESLEFLITARECDLCWITISEVGWNPDEGVIALTHEQSVKLIFGESNYREKLQSWREFYKTVVPSRGLRAFHTLDLRFKNQIVAKHT
ncbi:MAG: hypothetical protein EA360_05775 [Balneolaceae bacterium]|nr:MAG: hypothetical protein EA360_05775 [Balneolaceae bacterium]